MGQHAARSLTEIFDENDPLQPTAINFFKRPFLQESYQTKLTKSYSFITYIINNVTLPNLIEGPP